MRPREFSSPGQSSPEAPKTNAKNRIEASKVTERVTLKMLNKLEAFLADRENIPFSVESLRLEYLGSIKNVGAMKALLIELGGFTFGEKRAFGIEQGQNLRLATMVDKSAYEAGLAALKKKLEKVKPAKAQAAKKTRAPIKYAVKPKIVEAIPKGPLQFMMNEKDSEQTLALKGNTILVGRSLRGRKVATGDKITLVGDTGNYSVEVTEVSNQNAKADTADIKVKLIKAF